MQGEGSRAPKASPMRWVSKSQAPVPAVVTQPATADKRPLAFVFEKSVRTPCRCRLCASRDRSSPVTKAEVSDRLGRAIACSPLHHSAQ